MNRKGQDILSECQTLEMEDINNFIPLFLSVLLFSDKLFGKSNYWIVFTEEWWGTTVKWLGVPTDLYVVVLILWFLIEELVYSAAGRHCVGKHNKRRV